MSRQLEVMKAGVFSVYKQAGIPADQWEARFQGYYMTKAAALTSTPGLGPATTAPADKTLGPLWQRLKKFLTTSDMRDVQREPETAAYQTFLKEQQPKPQIPAEAVIPSLNPPGPAKPLDFSKLIPKAVLPLRKNKVEYPKI